VLLEEINKFLEAEINLRVVMTYVDFDCFGNNFVMLVETFDCLKFLLPGLEPVDLLCHQHFSTIYFHGFMFCLHFLDFLCDQGFINIEFTHQDQP
jgi:hypothetical protein